MPENDAPQTMDELATGLLVSAPKAPAASKPPATAGAEAAPPDQDDDLDAFVNELVGAEVEVDEEAGAGAKPEDEDNGPSTPEPLYTVKINGKDEQVTLAEALAGYQRQKDYTQDKMALSAREREAADQIAEARNRRLHYESLVNHIADRLDGVQPRTQQQWDELRAKDEIEFASEWASHQQRTEQRALVKQEQDRLAGMREQEQQTALNAFVADENVKLLDAIPAWKDEKRRNADSEKNVAHARSVGFTDDEIGQAYDHRMVKLVNDSRLLKELTAKLATARGKVEQAPAMAAPGVRSKPMSNKTKALLEANKKFTQSGKPEDGWQTLLQ
jgi:hypothetical protein